MRTCAYSLLSSCRCYTKQKMRDWYLLRDEMRTCAFSLSIFMSLLYTTETKDWKLLRDEMCTCAFSLSIFMSFLYTNTNERLVVGQGRVPLAYVAHTGTRCAPVPSRFLSSCPCYTKQKCETGSYSGTRCAPVPSRFLFSCPYFTKPDEMLPEDSETVLSTLRTLFAVPSYLSPQFFSSSLSFCFSHDSLLLGAP